MSISHSPRPRVRPCLALSLVLITVVPAAARAQAARPDLTRLSIEDLMNIEITSASRKEQRILDVAAAVFVITQEDIRRSGVSTIPGLLRMVPGVNVGQINGNKWAVSIRGFNSLFTNTVLVLVDGRSVYNRLYSGVFWDTMDLPLDDVDRIEVIRGPGAAAWGANAVNGVINIVTKAAADSTGGHVRADAGRNGTQVSARYGGTVGNTPFRAYAQWTGREETLSAPGVRAGDPSYSVTTGLRLDRTRGRRTLTLDGAFTAGRAQPQWMNLNAATLATEPYLRDSSQMSGGHIRGRWSLAPENGISMQIQSSVDLSDRREAVGHFSRRAFDLEAHIRGVVGGRHDLVAGAGYRLVNERLDGQNGRALTPPEERSYLLTAFVHDDIAIAPDRLHLILGTQFQHDSFSGAGLQPTARVMWHVRPRQRLWVAASRALRTPSLIDRRVRVDLPPIPSGNGLPLFRTLTGNAAAEAETFSDFEAGYRLEVGTRLSIDATAFVGRYENLITSEPGAPVLVAPPPRLVLTAQFRNLLTATTHGVEVAGHWAPSTSLTFDASVAVLDIQTSRPGATSTVASDAPKTQWQVRGVFTPTPRATVTAGLFHVDRLPTSAVDAYTRADVTGEWRLSDQLALMVIGQNLFDEAHAEFNGAVLLRPTQIPRNLAVRLRWAFR